MLARMVRTRSYGASTESTLVVSIVQTRAAELDAGAELLEHARHRPGVGELRNVAQRVDSRREQRRRHDRAVRRSWRR